MSRTPLNRYIHAYVHHARIGVLLEVATETHTLTTIPHFKDLVHDLALHIAGANPVDTETLLEQPFVKDNTRLVGDLLRDARAHYKENILIARFVRWDAEALAPQSEPDPPKGPAVIMRFQNK